MQITIQVNDAWKARPADFALLLEAAMGLEQPPARVIGGDDDNRDSMRQFAEGLEDDEPTPAATIAVKTYTVPPGSNARPASTRFPETGANGSNGHTDVDAHHARNVVKPGKRFFGWCKDQSDDTLKRVTRIGQRRGFPDRIVEWSAGMVDECRRELERSIVGGNGYHRDN